MVVFAMVSLSNDQIIAKGCIIPSQNQLDCVSIKKYAINLPNVSKKNISAVDRKMKNDPQLTWYDLRPTVTNPRITL